MSAKKIAGVVLIIFAGLSQLGYVPSFDRLPIPPFGQRVELVNAWFLVIEESAERPAYLSAIDADMPLRDEIKKLGARYLRLDKDSVDAEPYRDRAMSHGLPAYLLINGDGTVVSEGTLPETRDEVLAIVRQR
jgi:hypothetical protein